MNYLEINELKKLVNYNDTKPNTKILFDKDNRMILLTAIKKEQTIPAHHSETDAFVYCLKGKIKLQTLDNDSEYYLEKGEIVKCRPFVEHVVYGLEESKILVVRI